MKLFTITEKQAILFLNCQFFDKLQRRYILLNIPDFLQGGKHKGCLHIRGEGGQAKVDKCGQREGEG